MTDPARAARAFQDIVAVERLAPGLCRVVSVRSAHRVDARDGGCECADKRHNQPDECKHEIAARAALGDDLPAPAPTTDSLDDPLATTNDGLKP